MTGSLDGKVGIVTGAGSGIGRATARALAAAGASVVAADIDVAGGNRTVQDICSGGGRAHFMPTDVSQSVQVAAMVDDAVQRYGHLDSALPPDGTRPSTGGECVGTPVCPRSIEM